MTTRNASRLVALTTLATTIGCSSLNYSSSSRSKLGMAESNTSEITSGQSNYSMLPARVDWLDNGHDRYASEPRNSERTVEIEWNGDSYKLPNNLVLDARLIPRSNSTTARWSDRIETTANGENSYFVNASYDKNGALQLTTEGEPKESFFVLERRQFPSEMVQDDFETRFEEWFDTVQRNPSLVNVEGRTLVPAPDRDLEGRRSNVYWSLDSIKPFSETIRTPSANGGFNTIFKGGVVAEGWYIQEGTEVQTPEGMLNDNAQGFQVIGGESNPQPEEPIISLPEQQPK